VATISALGTAHSVCAPYDGLVTELLTACGQSIEYDQPVLRMATA
jgi:biotin carboxyl carrier protein